MHAELLNTQDSGRDSQDRAICARLESHASLLRVAKQEGSDRSPQISDWNSVWELRLSTSCFRDRQNWSLECLSISISSKCQVELPRGKGRGQVHPPHSIYQ